MKKNLFLAFNFNRRKIAAISLPLSLFLDNFCYTYYRLYNYRQEKVIEI